MKVPRFLLAPIFSLFDFNLYREVRSEKFGVGVLYGLYLSAILSVILSVMAVLFIPRADNFVNWLKKESPNVTFTAAGMKLDQPGKIIVTHPKLGPIIGFDDSKQAISFEEMEGTKIFLTATMVYTQDGKGGVQARPLPIETVNNSSNDKKNLKLRIEGSDIQVLYQRFKILAVAVFIITIFIFSFIFRLITGLIFAALGFLIQLAIPRGLDFEKLFVLAAFALSIGMIFGAFQYVPAVAKFFSGGVGFLLSLVYFGIAIAVQPKLVAK